MYSCHSPECQFEDWQECNNTCDLQKGYQSRYTTEYLCPCVNVSSYYETRECYDTSKQPCQGIGLCDHILVLLQCSPAIVAEPKQKTLFTFFITQQ